MRLLIVGQKDGPIRDAVKIAQQKGVEVFFAESLPATLEILRGAVNVEAVFADLAMEPLKLLSAMAAERLQTPVFVCGSGRAGKDAATAVRAGARDYIPLPASSEEIADVLAIIDRQRSRQACYADPLMKEVVARADRAAASDASILITGESGTGKEVMARYIHSRSRRAGKPFVAINCAAIPENLLESELFGHEKGAFTGALAARIGKFKQADGGTLLLDEISEMDLALQAKLLRVIQEKEVDPIGADHAVKVDVRILSTSNRDMRKAITNKVFREDLYFRLNVVEMTLPPLRKRPEDIKALSQLFIEKFSELEGKTLLPLSEEAQKALLAYSWGGNVRELENAMRRAVIFGGPAEITTAAIFQKDIWEPVGEEFPRKSQTPLAVEGIREKDYIANTLDYTKGDIRQAAEILGLSVRHLQKKVEDYKYATKL